MLDQSFVFLQRVGKALMLPVAVLPVAGLLLGIGAAKISIFPAALSTVMEQSGGTIFHNLPLLFAIAVALGFTANDSVSALSATIGYVVMRATMGALAPVLGLGPLGADQGPRLRVTDGAAERERSNSAGLAVRSCPGKECGMRVVARRLYGVCQSAPRWSQRLSCRWENCVRPTRSGLAAVAAWWTRTG
jgi:hypothetical protein